MNTLSRLLGGLSVLACSTLLACGANTDAGGGPPPEEELTSAPSESAPQAEEVQVTRAVIQRGDEGWVVQGLSSDGEAVTLPVESVLVRGPEGQLSEFDPEASVEKLISCWACGCSDGYCVCFRIYAGLC